MARIHVVGRRLYAGSTQFRAWGMNWGIGTHAPVLAYFDDPSNQNFDVLVAELRTAHELGANSMRIPLELGQVMKGPTETNPDALQALRRLLAVAEADRVYLDITGNLVWRADRVPAWYDRLSEEGRWGVQAAFWRAVAHAAASSPAVLCYEMSSEPAISDEPGFYAGDFGGFSFQQIVAHPNGRDADLLARAWTQQLAQAVRSQDKRPVTIGMLPEAEESFSPENVGALLDMIVIHEYPLAGQAAKSIALVRHYESFAKPVLLGETYMLWSDEPTMHDFLLGANRYVVGTLEFFDGRDPNHMRVTTLQDAFYQLCLRQFTALRDVLLKPGPG